MSHFITSVDPHSPAARAGARAGDRLVRLNGEIVVDFLDYQALSANRRVRAELLRDGARVEIACKKGEYDPLGMNFETPMMSGVRMCCNHCLFCFVDQLPPGVRAAMRVKDDDWRMSLMMGNYVTLTNVSDRELDRIVARRASPLYISVHAADPDLRERMMRTPRARRLMDQLRRLSDGGVEFHCQAVLCPGLNDGAALEETIRALVELPGAQSLALVPVGLTGWRDGLAPLRKYRPDEARAVLDIANRWRAKLLAERGGRFVFPSDEILPSGRRAAARGRGIRGLRPDRRRRRDAAPALDAVFRSVGRAARGAPPRVGRSEAGRRLRRLGRAVSARDARRAPRRRRAGRGLRG